jgi:glycine/D-amino acid oxidase-like deaminating enzyme
VNEYPFWWDTVPALRAGSERSELTRQKVDVAVVGGGYTGLSAARRLAQTGAEVSVFEREHAGWGASSRNGGQVLTGLKLDPATLVARYGDRRARGLFEISLEAIAHLEALIQREQIACEFERTGHIQAAWKPAHFKAFVEEQALLARVFAHRVELVPREGQREEIGSDRYYGLLIDQQSAGLNPAQFVRGLAAAAERAGVSILEKTGVTGIARNGSGWTVRTTAGEVDARDVLIATDGYTTELTPALHRRLVAIGSYVIATERLDAAVAARLIPQRRMVFDSKNFLYYFRLSADRRLIFGGRAEFSKPTTESVRHAAAILRGGMAEVFPELASTRIEYAWGGAVGFTQDQLPHAGRLNDQYYATGYCGHGIAMAAHLGDLVARRMAGEPIEHPFLDDRFAPIPLFNGNPWFLPIVGAYYTMKDWLT